MNDRPRHPPMDQFTVIDDCLQVGGIGLTQLADRVGTTPFYAYDRRLLTERVQSLRKTLPPEIELHYAIKANPMPAVVQHMAGLVDGLDVASLGELGVALNSGMPPSEISFAGPGKSEDELSAAIAAGIALNLESEGELRRVLKIAETQSRTPRIAVRVNPDFELKASGMKMSGGPKAFGIDAERVPQLLTNLASLPVEFLGFHIFTGSQNLSANAIIEAQNQTVELALRLADHAPAEITVLNIGGGFGIPYFPGETRLDLTPIGENLHELVRTVGQRMPRARMVVELGRYLVGEAGIYVTRILDRKMSRGEVFLVTDGGLHHHLAASGNFGQVIRKNYPVVIGNRVCGGERETANVVGRLCTPLDILANRYELARGEPGDLVVIFQSGAYGFTASPRSFLGHPPPVEVLV